MIRGFDPLTVLHYCCSDRATNLSPKTAACNSQANGNADDQRQRGATPTHTSIGIKTHIALLRRYPVTHYAIRRLCRPDALPITLCKT
jgi:hypothetical protein